MREWETWAAQLLETQISYPLLAFYRSQHSNQSWLSALTTILDSSALLLVGPDASHKRQARLTFAMARHAIVDITQNFVAQYRPNATDRLPRAELERLLKHLERTSLPMPLTTELEERLTFLRRTYEPYAQALETYLLYELPPWMHAGPRRDNWRSGPWDKQLGVQSHPGESGDEHF